MTEVWIVHLEVISSSSTSLPGKIFTRYVYLNCSCIRYLSVRKNYTVHTTRPTHQSKLIVPSAHTTLNPLTYICMSFKYGRANDDVQLSSPQFSHEDSRQEYLVDLISSRDEAWIFYVSHFHNWCLFSMGKFRIVSNFTRRVSYSIAHTSPDSSIQFCFPQVASKCT